MGNITYNRRIPHDIVLKVLAMPYFAGSPLRNWGAEKQLGKKI